MSYECEIFFKDETKKLDTGSVADICMDFSKAFDTGTGGRRKKSMHI